MSTPTPNEVLTAESVKALKAGDGGRPHPCYDEHRAGCDCFIPEQKAAPMPSYLERIAAPASQPITEGEERSYLLMKRGLYYRPAPMGYTGIKDNAGRYTRDEAELRADHASGVTMVHEEEADDFSPACFDDLARAHLVKKLEAREAELSRLRECVRKDGEALVKIELWHGEFPETGRFWPNEDGSISDRPMSYGSVWGSNGERDFMRSIARARLEDRRA